MDINETYKKLTGVDVLEQNVRIGKVTNVTAGMQDVGHKLARRRCLGA